LDVYSRSRGYLHWSFENYLLLLQVDIISIDFSAKLPFRLKQDMVKMAIQVCSREFDFGFKLSLRS
jgi:hypothetical protein